MPTDVSTILKLSVPLIVQIGRRTTTLQTVLGLCPGAIIELEKPADAELELLVNNKPIAMGYAVKVAENFGIRIESIGSSRERVEAMVEGE